MFLEMLQNSQENTCARVSFSVKLLEGRIKCIKGELARFLKIGHSLTIIKRTWGVFFQKCAIWHPSYN